MIKLTVQISVCLYKLLLLTSSTFCSPSGFVEAELSDIVLREAIEEELLKQMLVEWEIFETLEVEGSQKKAKFRSQFEKLCYLCRRNCLMAMGIHSSNQTPTKLKKT